MPARRAGSRGVMGAEGSGVQSTHYSTTPTLHYSPLQCQLGGEGGLGGMRDGSESGAEPIACRFEHAAGATLDDVSQQGGMAGQRLPHRLSVLVPEAGVALEVREQKRYVSGRHRGGPV